MFEKLNHYEKTLFDYIRVNKLLDINDELFKREFIILSRRMKLEESLLGLEIESDIFVNAFLYSTELANSFKNKFTEAEKEKRQIIKALKGLKTELLEDNNQGRKLYTFIFPKENDPEEKWKDFFLEIFVEDFSKFDIGQQISFGEISNVDDMEKGWKKRFIKDFGTFTFKVTDICTRLNPFFEGVIKRKKYEYHHVDYIYLIPSSMEPKK